MSWNQVKTFGQFQKLMISFLKGELDQNPWHYGSVDPETIPILDKLREINRLGLVTVEGQPGVKVQNTIGIPDSELGNIGSPYMAHQRGYMSGFMKNDQVHSFLEKLLKTKKVLIFVDRLDQGIFGLTAEDISHMGPNDIPLKAGADLQVVVSPVAFYELSTGRKIPKESQYYLEEAREAVIPLTIESSANNRHHKYHTNFFVPRSLGRTETRAAPPELRKLLVREASYITVMMRTIGDPSLEDIVLKAL